jgi:chromate reductase
MPDHVIGVIVGSNRRQSLNARLAQSLVRDNETRSRFTFIAIDDLPLFNQDFETAPPPGVARFKSMVAAVDALLVVTPEHNRSIPAVLKSAIDWGSRPREANVWNGKPTAITGTAPGAIGTALAQQHLRQLLATLGALVVGGEAYISFHLAAIGDDGAIGNPATRKFLSDYLAPFFDLVERLTPAARTAAAA